MTPARTGHPLAALESLRRRHLEAAQGALAAAVASSLRARDSAARATERLREATRSRRAAELLSPGGSAPELGVQGRWLERLRSSERRKQEELERCEASAARAAAEEEGGRARLLEAQRQLRTVERHREIWELARRLAAQAAEEAELEDRQLAADAQRRR